MLAQPGLRWIIIFYGTNDIAAGASASTITQAYKTIIDDAHSKEIKVFGATITPFKGSGHYSQEGEIIRNTVNQWIRNSDNFDGVIDFDQYIRDPNDPEKLTAEFSKDWLHPNEAGLEFLGNAVDLNLFTSVKRDKTLFSSLGTNQPIVGLENSDKVTIQLNKTP